MKVYIYLAALIVIALGCWWGWDHIYGRGVTAQAAKDKITIDALKAQIADDAKTLKAANDAAADEKKKADDKQAQAYAAVAAISQDKVKAQNAAVTWQKKYEAALKTPECHAAEEELCDALSNY
jgi:hypothetical protein